MKDNVPYFSHDSDAHGDLDIQAMRQKYGLKGYGLYWVIVENLRVRDDYKIPLNRCSAIASQVSSDYISEEVVQFVQDCINEFNLFSTDGTYFWSESLLRRMERKNEISENNRNAANARWNNYRNANAMQTHNARNAIKEKKNKEKENKELSTGEESVSQSSGITMRDVEIFWNQNIRPITPVEFQKLEAWSNDTGVTPEVIIEAIRSAVFSNKRRFDYIEGIIRNWTTAGIKTIDDLSAYKRDRDEEVKNRGTTTQDVNPVDSFIVHADDAGSNVSYLPQRNKAGSG